MVTTKESLVDPQKIKRRKNIYIYHYKKVNKSQRRTAKREEKEL